MADYGKCSLCGGKYKFVEAREINNTEYNILKCEKCNHEVAKEQK